MSCFPLFIELSGKRVLIAGGGKNTQRKVEILLRFGADITLVSPLIPKECIPLAESGQIRLLQREYRSEDMEGAVLALSVSEVLETDEKVYSDAREKGIPVNVEDKPELCTFLFPSVVVRGDFAVGITTSGSYPALSRYARQKIEALFPESYREMTEVLKECRKTVFQTAEDAGVRRKQLRQILKKAMELADRGEIDHLKERLTEEISHF